MNTLWIIVLFVGVFVLLWLVLACLVGFARNTKANKIAEEWVKRQMDETITSGCPVIKEKNGS